MTEQMEEQNKRLRDLLIRCGSYLAGSTGHCRCGCEPDTESTCSICEAWDLIDDIKDELEMK